MRKLLLSLAIVALVAGACGCGVRRAAATPQHRIHNTTTQPSPASRAASPYDGVTFDDPGINPITDTDEDRDSTFAMDVDTASYGIAQRFAADGFTPGPRQRPGRGMGQRLRPGLPRRPRTSTFAVHVDGGADAVPRRGRAPAPDRHQGPRIVGARAARRGA